MGNFMGQTIWFILEIIFKGLKKRRKGEMTQALYAHMNNKKN
jgi:hypothetical protein